MGYVCGFCGVVYASTLGNMMLHVNECLFHTENWSEKNKAFVLEEK